MRSVVALAVGVMTLAVAPGAKADNYFEVEHARANARAGGPISDRDAELLDRYGALSGTPDWRARAPAPYGYRSDAPPRKVYKKSKRRD
ncbi:MAG: hypothetical protein C0519_11540 [Hyphomicrobium sp.]|jgi:hypothetical protein|nr:hypothetical protein [Hyphomicrobium sp.]PPD07202.1 MAG: hypothetical protein CTY28_10505 [Hyphomicrobium sp.]